MKKIRNRNKETEQKEVLGNEKKIILFAVIGVLAFILAVLMIIENQSGYIRVTNRTDIAVEELKAYFVYAEGRLEEEVYEYYDIQPGKQQTRELRAIDLLGLEANLEIRFIFEGYEHKYVVDAGLFNDYFDGKVAITFDQTEDGLISMKIKASSGFLSSQLITCDEEHIIDYQTGDISD